MTTATITIKNTPFSLTETFPKVLDFERDQKSISLRIEDMYDFFYVQKIKQEKKRTYKDEKAFDKILERFAK